MYEPTDNDYVLIIDNKDECYLQIGKIVEIVNEPFYDYVNTYIIEFYDFRYSIKYRRAYKGSIFEDCIAKVLDFKR